MISILFHLPDFYDYLKSKHFIERRTLYWSGRFRRLVNETYSLLLLSLLFKPSSTYLLPSSLVHHSFTFPLLSPPTLGYRRSSLVDEALVFVGKTSTVRDWTRECVSPTVVGGFPYGVPRRFPTRYTDRGPPELPSPPGRPCQ